MAIDTMACPACTNQIVASAAVCEHCGKGGRYLLAEDEQPRIALNAGGQDEASSRKPAGIEGWLLLPAIGLVLAPIKGAVMLFITWRLVQLVQPELARDPRFWISGLLDGAVIVALLGVSIVFFKKRRAAVSAMIALMVALVVTDLVQAALSAAMLKGAEPAQPVMPVRQFIYAAIWIPYFRRSARVRNTFTV